MKHYHINAFYSEDDGYIADIPDFQHCSAFGATPEEASQEVLKAKQVWLEAARASGKPIPAPRYRPVIDQAVRGTPQKQPQRSNTLGRPPRLCRAASHPPTGADGPQRTLCGNAGSSVCGPSLTATVRLQNCLLDGKVW